MDDIVKDFLIESRENLDRLDQELIRLESDPASKDLLASIFRTIHTIKGSCGFLGFSHLEKVAHAGESLLSKLRDGVLALDQQITSGLLATLDAIRRMLGEIEATEHDGEDDYPALLEKLKELQDVNRANSENPFSEGDPTGTEQVASVLSGVASDHSGENPYTAAVEAPTIPAFKNHPIPPLPQFRPLQAKIGGLLVDRGSIDAEDLALALHEQELGDRRRLGEILVALKLCRQDEIDAAQQILEARGRATGAETVRVRVDLLDLLMNLVGELVLARNQLLQIASSAQDGPLQTVSQRMNLIVSDVQQQVMKTRMQPIGNLWNKFPRTVRDLAVSCGKEVHLAMEGQDTELDRTILEAIKDPLIHLVRNAIDHGIELPEARKHAGKNVAGNLRLRAFQEGGKVNIEISDDGGGLDIDRLTRKAIERGLIRADQAKTMAERDIFNLIFLPGFSTAEKVTNVSGRGVGMDVVKTNVEKIGGAIGLESVPGKGTTVRVKIPLTVAIVPALIVSCSSERFAIPQVSVLELLALDNETNARGIESVHGIPVYRLRGNLLPLVYLNRELGVASSGSRQPSGAASIVVLQAENRLFGLIVDDILETEEIVVKPLGDQLKAIRVFSGATIMGDGRVALILDVPGLARAARLLTDAQQTRLELDAEPICSEINPENHTVLLAQNGKEGRVAIPLSTVTRLEVFPASLIHWIGDREVIAYRGQVIPLVRLSRLVPPGNSQELQAISEESIEVVVYSEGERTVGLVVDCILDIVEEQAAIDRMATRSGVTGSYLIENDITELLDIPAVLRAAAPELFGQAETRPDRRC